MQVPLVEHNGGNHANHNFIYDFIDCVDICSCLNVSFSSDSERILQKNMLQWFHHVSYMGRVKHVAVNKISLRTDNKFQWMKFVNEILRVLNKKTHQIPYGLGDIDDFGSFWRSVIYHLNWC